MAAILFIGSLLLGAGTLRDISLSLFIGILVGTYSTIFIAAPIYSQFRGHETEVQEVRLEESLCYGGHVMTETTPREGRTELTAAEAIAEVTGGAYLLDVREQHEWEAGHAPAAHLLPMSQLNERVAEVPDDREVLVVCHLGGRSAQVTATLRRNGYNAVDVLGGMVAWQIAEGELTTDNGSEPSVG